MLHGDVQIYIKKRPRTLITKAEGDALIMVWTISSFILSKFRSVNQLSKLDPTVKYIIIISRDFTHKGSRRMKWKGEAV